MSQAFIGKSICITTNTEEQIKGRILSVNPLDQTITIKKFGEKFNKSIESASIRDLELLPVNYEASVSESEEEEEEEDELAANDHDFENNEFRNKFVEESTQSNISGESSSSSSSSSNQENTTTSSESQASSLNNQFQKINAALQDNNKRGRIRLLKKGEDFENNLSGNTNGHINSNVDWPTNGHGHENGHSNGRVHSELFENMGFYKLNKNTRQNNHQNNHQNHHQNDDQKSPNNNGNDQNLQKEYHLWQDINGNAPKTNQNHKSNNPNNHHSNNPSPANCRERRRSKSSFGGDFNPEEEFDFSISNKLFNKHKFYKAVDSAPEADVPEYEKIAKAQEAKIQEKFYKHTENVLQTTSKPVTPDMMKNKNKLAKKLLKSQKSAKTATASSTPDVSKPGTPLPISASFPPPTITPAEFNEILTKSESYYHPFSRQAENFSLNLTSWLTGSAVLNLKVRSIPPHILVLVGAGRQGALAMNVVRQILRKFNVSITVFVLPKVEAKETSDEFILESRDQISAVKMMDVEGHKVQFANRVANLIELLDDSPADIDFCLDGISFTSGKYQKSGKKWYEKLVDYLTNQDIPVMSIDPVSVKSQIDSPNSSSSSVGCVPARWRVFSVLPIEGEVPRSGNTFTFVFDSGIPLCCLPVEEYLFKPSQNFARIVL